MLKQSSFQQPVKSVALIAITMLTALWPHPAMALMGWDAYIPPELAFKDDIRQKVTLPKKLNINQSSLTQLQVLPGFDEEIALKVMRGRPFSDIQDFYGKLPGLSKKQIDTLIEQIQPKILFK